MNSEPPKCGLHPEISYSWFKNLKGRNVYACQVCHGVAQEQISGAGPLFKYSPTYWRERPLTDQEKRTPPKRG